jgi:hypothetical protein
LREPSCEGAWTAPTVVYFEEKMGVSSVAISVDELELIFDTGVLPDHAGSFRRAVRASTQETFTSSEALPELDAACEPGMNRSGDLSRDGLTFYMTCYTQEDYSGTVRIARRSESSATFVLDPTDYGAAGFSVTPSPDELTLYSSNPDLVSGPFLQSRTGVDEAFGPTSPVPGLETAALFAPSLSTDGLELYAAQADNLAVSRRESVTEAFSAPEPLLPTESQRGSPELSDDCRSLYFVDINTAANVWTVQVSTR